MTTAYITAFKGRLTTESTLIIDGCEYPIPATTKAGGLALRRIADAIYAAGYTVAGDYYAALSDVDDNGGYTIELVKL